MSELLDPDNLDAVLRQAMQSRPEPPMATDLASRVIARAASRDALTKFVRVRRWNRALTALAAVFIIALAAWVIRARLSAGGFQEWSDTSTATSTAVSGSSASTAPDNSTTPMQWMFFGAAMAVGAVVVVMTQRALSDADDRVTSWAAGDFSHSIHV